MLDVVTALLALLIFFIGPHWLLDCIHQAELSDTTGEPLSGLTWTLAAVLGAYLIGLAFLVLVITAVRQTAPT